MFIPFGSLPELDHEKQPPVSALSLGHAALLREFTRLCPAHEFRERRASQVLPTGDVDGREPPCPPPPPGGDVRDTSLLAESAQAHNRASFHGGD